MEAATRKCGVADRRGGFGDGEGKDEDEDEDESEAEGKAESEGQGEEDSRHPLVGEKEGRPPQGRAEKNGEEGRCGEAGEACAEEASCQENGEEGRC